MRELVFSQISPLTMQEKDASEKGVVIILVDDNGRCAPEATAAVGEAFLSRFKQSYAFCGKRFHAVSSLGDAEKPYDRVILLGVGDATTLENDSWLKLGGAACAALEEATHANILLAVDQYDVTERNVTDFLTGLQLRHYNFDKYQVRKNQERQTVEPLNLTLQCRDAALAKRALNQASIISEGVNLSRNLVNEPANVLGTEEFAIEVKKLEDVGLKVKILDEEALKKFNMGALLSVAQGSTRPARVAVIQWDGGQKHDKPLAFVGKGVVFDSGGISLKPSSSMEEMKGDMAGAATVAGLMYLLAKRQASVNAVGVIGIVENMPDGGAQRPGDIVTSMSGQTIEVINTDAEGRLVLADILYYTHKEFQPCAMVNLATLTGGVMVALGQHCAGLFSNDDRLADNLFQASTISGENLWRMPLSKDYDALVDSKVADMRNSCGRNASAITAAQFLQRFVGDTAWAHLDIAGTAIESLKNEYNQSWASGFGVRLLDQFVSDYYEV